MNTLFSLMTRAMVTSISRMLRGSIPTSTTRDRPGGR
jgi:hypothetical protein